MTPVELVIVLVLLLLAVPDVCEKMGRPAMAYTIYILAGVLVRPLLDDHVAILLFEIGKIGFVLLLFEIGLDIDLPHSRHWWTPLKLAAKWILPQVPVVVALGTVAGLSLREAVIAAVALNGCSLSMSFAAWRDFPTPGAEQKRHLLLWMISLEIVAIILLTAGDLFLREGMGWPLIFRLFLIVGLVMVVSLTAERLMGLLGRVLGATTRWRLHYVVLFILLVSAFGSRLGLAAPKTAFLLGLFVSRATHEGLALSHHLRPIGQRLLIPVFFLSLGAAVPVGMIFSRTGLLALGSAGLLLGLRDRMHATFVRSGCSRWAFLLACPNLTMVAIAAQTLVDLRADAAVVAWLVLTGLILSAGSVLAMPAREPAPA
jgi:Kef-type K+ transport system membrane component KefB